MSPMVAETKQCWADRKQTSTVASIPCGEVGIPPLFLCFRHYEEVVGAPPGSKSKTTT